MTSQNSSPFFSRPPLATKDSPLSPAGRFNRLSYIGWYGFLNLAVFLTSLLVSLMLGIFNFSSGTLDENYVSAFSSVTGLGFIAILLLYLYFNLVLIIRRLHDLNQSGWMSLLFLVPLINFFFALYLLLAPGSAGLNGYGYPRTASTGEKIMAWLMMILTLLSLFSMGSMMSYRMGSGELSTPAEMMQQGSKYF